MHSQRFLRGTAILCVLLASLVTGAGCGQKGAAPSTEKEQPKESVVTEELKIGVIAPLSGTGAGWGLAIRAGAEMAAEDVNNAGGLKIGNKVYTIRVIPYDTKYTSQGGADAANRLVYEDNVKFIVGPMSSAAAIAAQEITEPNKVIMIGDSFTTKFLSPNKLYSFRCTMSAEDFARPMQRWFAEAYPEVKRIAIVGPNDETGWEVSESDKKGHEAAGHEIVFQDYYERGTQDFTPLLTRAVASRPDAIDLDGSNPGDAGLMVKQLREMGYTGLIIKTGGPGTPEMLGIAGAAAMEGYIYYSPMNPDDPKVMELNKRYEAKYPPPMNGFTPSFYDGARLLFSCIEKAGTVENTDAVKEALENTTSFEGLSGTMTWSGKESYGINHQLVFPFYVGKVQGGKETIIAKVNP